MAASRDDGPAAAYPACPVQQQGRGVPVGVTEGGADRLSPVPAGTDG
ncbi:MULTISPECIES: hypothetical protein [unclassified Streptomyces]